MNLRAAKAALVLGVALFYTFVVFNNVTDYESNYQFVRHTLLMDSTFANNHGMWRAIKSPYVHTAFYVSIISWEFITMLLCWWGGLRLARALRQESQRFQDAKNLAIGGLALGLFMWLVAFLDVGGEWFLMWQSQAWNGQSSAFRMFTVLGIVLLLLVQPEAEERP
jgi:predicted small integral membrane protein